MSAAHHCQNNWGLEDVVCTTRGSKVAKLRSNGDGSVCVYTPDSFLRIPFEPGTFDKDPKASRVNLAIECDADLRSFIESFDDWVVKHLAEHSERIFKKRMTVEQVQAGYSSCLKHAPEGKDYPPTIKTKMDVAPGAGAVRCWGKTTGEQMSAPAQWRNMTVRPRLLFSHLWIMGAQFGVVVKVTDVQLGDAADRVVSNPFE